MKKTVQVNAMKVCLQIAGRSLLYSKIHIRWLSVYSICGSIMNKDIIKIPSHGLYHYAYQAVPHTVQTEQNTWLSVSFLLYAISLPLLPILNIYTLLICKNDVRKSAKQKTGSCCVENRLWISSTVVSVFSWQWLKHDATDMQERLVRVPERAFTYAHKALTGWWKRLYRESKQSLLWAWK